MSIVQMEQITKHYRMGGQRYTALQHISLEVQEGEFVAIQGPSGSGKSTLMNIMGCLDTADSGTYMLEGRRVSAMNDNQLADVRNRRIGFIFQNYNLIPTLSAYDNVELPLIYRGVPGHQRKKAVLDTLESVGLSGHLHHRPAELSGGQQQRVSIARALATNPSILLADEPTGALDSHTGKEIMALLAKLHAEGRTIILITHDQSVASYADRVLYIRDGAIA
ncbi:MULTISPECIES: ABC transporter ATP-binding protein [unclassified Paenibacillus]|uniref:ABC transporter ATP-binding protein n=1 Tax=unclassified Paenibacillus TaxID=185978 RepID=UPI00104A360B|nr:MULTISPECIES: ABC transporter ATP-binding protein [unclassified Paenibacillus]NIK70867.1 putative ABC transport system ATP-binding protein [Paenibacillus sp. BK720]TCM93155.1 putative ABC transport system ATP-binding protein [Paenibacillus sp. BK033]